MSDLLDIAHSGKRHTLLLALLRQVRMHCRDELIEMMRRLVRCVRRAEAGDCAARGLLPFLPAYSPDPNPIKPVFAKLRLMPRKVALRIVDAFRKAPGSSIGVSSPRNAETASAMPVIFTAGKNTLPY